MESPYAPRRAEEHRRRSMTTLPGGEPLNAAKLIISDVQRFADDEDMKDIVELLNMIGSLQ